MARRGAPDDPDDSLSEEERRLFESEMRDVRRIDPGVGRVVPKVKPAPVRAPTTPSAAAPPAMTIERAGEQVSAFDPSLSAAQRRALRQANARPEAVLDLHGLRLADATRRVEAFLHGARHAGHRRVLIVTGRGLRSGPGGPVLRGEIIQLLTEGPLRTAVLGLVSAPPSLGGPGALLLLLRG